MRAGTQCDRGAIAAGSCPATAGQARRPHARLDIASHPLIPEARQLYDTLGNQVTIDGHAKTIANPSSCNPI